MQKLRQYLFVVIGVVTVIPIAFGCILLAFMPFPVRYRFTILYPRIVIWAARVVCGLDYRVEGMDNLPDGPCVLLPKHQSTWETFYFPVHMPRELCYVYKRELHWVPFFGWGIALLRMVHIDRARGTDAFESVVRQGTQRMKEGRWIIMFPEGTRTPVGKAGRYKTGGPRLAIRMGVPVVPIAHNAGEFWPKKHLPRGPGVITVSIGKPIESTGRTPEQLTSAVESWIESEMRRISPHAYADVSPPPV
jgi:1-acyl-sn-glycerol-3-phosphate acyltransferase